MVQDIKKIKYKKEEKLIFKQALKNWGIFLMWLKEQDDDALVYRCLRYEIDNGNRPQFIDRARTRFNKLRAYRELKELEKLSGKVISVNYV